MKKVNKHGLKIKGLKATSGDLDNFGTWDGRYNEIFYDMETGALWAKFHYGNEYSVYRGYPSIIKVGSTCRHLTMQELADRTAEAVAEYQKEEKRRQYERECDIEREKRAAEELDREIEERKKHWISIYR